MENEEHCHVILSGVLVKIALSYHQSMLKVSPRPQGDAGKRRRDVEVMLNGKIVSRSRLLQGKEIFL